VGALAPLFATAAPRALLARLLDGDPLGLEQRARGHLEQQALLLDPERLFLRAVARAAFAGARRDDAELSGAWIDSQVERAAADLMDEDRAAERAGAATDPGEARYAFLADALGVVPEVARRACVVFNDLPRRVRRAWWLAVVERRPLERCVIEGLGTPQQVRADLRRALLTLSMLEDPGDDPGQGGGEHDA
jgi:hypothetical protein